MMRNNKGQFAKGDISWNKNITGYTTTKRGMKMPKEVGQKIGDKLRGRKLSEERIAQMKETFKGRKNPFYGKHHTKESNEKNRLAHIGKTHSGSFKKGHPSYLTDESKKKISESNKGKIFSEDYRAKLKEARKKQKSYYSSKIEVKIQNYLKGLNVDFFIHQYIKGIEHSYACDIFVPSMNLVIETDGNYWHHYPTGKEIDHIRTKELLEKGFKVLRLWEFEINKMTIDKFKERLNAI